MARTTLLNDKLIDKTQEYIDDCIAKDSIPYQERLAIILDIDPDSVTNWSTRGKDLTDGTQEKEEKSKQVSEWYKNFFGLIKRLKSLQRLMLQEKLIKSNSIGAMFLLKTKHGYMETDKRIHEGAPTTIVVADIGYNPTKPLKPATDSPTAKSEATPS